MMNLKELEKAIAELNAPKEMEGETYDSMFNFKMVEYGDTVRVYDSNEMYHCDYAFESYLLMCQAADEFGFDAPNGYDDMVYDTLNEAVKADIGDRAYLEWNTHIDMVVATC